MNKQSAIYKNPWIAGVLNFLFAGSGYIYLRRRVIFGSVLLIAEFITWIWYLQSGQTFDSPLLTIVALLISAAFGIDAYREAISLNKGNNSEISLQNIQDVERKNHNNPFKKWTLIIFFELTLLWNILIGSTVLGIFLKWFEFDSSAVDAGYIIHNQYGYDLITNIGLILAGLSLGVIFVLHKLLNRTNPPYKAVGIVFVLLVILAIVLNSVDSNYREQASKHAKNVNNTSSK